MKDKHHECASARKRKGCLRTNEHCKERSTGPGAQQTPVRTSEVLFLTGISQRRRSALTGCVHIAGGNAPGQAIPGNVRADGDEEHVAAELNHPLLNLAQCQPHPLLALLPTAGLVGCACMHVYF